MPARRLKARKELAVGDARWVFFANNGEEFDYEVEPAHPKTLRVEIIGVGAWHVEEQTWTKNRKVRLGGGGTDWCAVLPPGARLAGWVLKDFEDGDPSARWVRRRKR